MKDLRPIKGRYYLQRLIAEGEHEHQDFKFAISDARKIARSISAFANHDGGSLLIGVKDNGVIAGVRNEEDIYVVEQAAAMYCRPEQHLDIKAYKADDGAVVIRASIEPSDVRPVQAQDTDGRWCAYYRVADENIMASPLMVKSWKRKMTSEPIVLSLSEAENMLLHILRESESVTLELFMREARLSRQAAEDIITRLYAIDVIDFAFIEREFRLILSSDNQ